MTDIFLHLLYFSFVTIGFFKVAIGEKNQIPMVDRTKMDTYAQTCNCNFGRTKIAKKKKKKLKQKHEKFDFICNPPEKILIGNKIAKQNRYINPCPK